MSSSYYPTIGIECHVQLKTRTKLFAAVANDAREAQPNTLISHICLGLPGSLPVLNKKAVELATRAALALGVKPQKFSKFDRKHYFYPDLPKGYQISQYDQPIIVGGKVHITLHGQARTINLTRAHLEEDAGKSTHPEGKDYSLVDLNRAGTPLLEIVSEPEIHSAEEAKAYAKELWLLMRYAGVSDADLYYGNMRFDVNVSVSSDPNKLGVRSETKNLNSFRSVEKAVIYEVARQSELLDKGQTIKQETRGWDDAKQKTFPQRDKEDAHDYRYFPEPDIPPIELTDEYITKVQTGMPIMPNELRDKLLGLSIDKAAVETLISSITAAHFLNDISNNAASSQQVRRIANWLSTDVQGEILKGQLSWETVRLDQKSLVDLTTMVDEGMLSSTTAKQVLLELIVNGGSPKEIAQDRQLLQVSDKNELEEIVKQVINANPKACDDIKAGETKAIGFLVGETMKRSQGSANPGKVRELILDLLDVKDSDTN